MTSKNETRFYKEPTRDEIALHAYLLWEKDGGRHGSDGHYWLEAETRLREQRRKQAEAAAAEAARPWPPGRQAVKAVPVASKFTAKEARTKSSSAKAAPVAAKAAPKPTAAKLAPLPAPVVRGTAVKAGPPAKFSATRPTGRTALRAAR